MWVEEDVSTKQYKEKENLWVLIQDEHKGGKKCFKQKEEKGEKKACGVTIMHALFIFAFPGL